MKPSVFDYEAIARRINELNGKRMQEPKCNSCLLPLSDCICPVVQPVAPIVPPPPPNCRICQGTGREPHPIHKQYELPCSACRLHFYSNVSQWQVACSTCYDVGWLWRQNLIAGTYSWHICLTCKNPQGKPSP